MALKRITRTILTLFSLISAALLLLSIASVYINPSALGVLTLFGFGFPVFLILNLTSLVFWLLKKRIQVLIPICVLLLSWPQLTNIFQWKSSKATTKESISTPLSIMSFNVRMFDFYDWTGREGNREKIFDFIREKNPDIICIQEFFSARDKKGFSENHILARLNQYPYQHLEYNAVHNNDRKFGMATFSKYPITAKRQLTFKNTTNFSIQTDIQVNDKQIRVFNNHLESIRFNRQNLNFLDSINHKNETERREGIKEIINKLNKATASRANQAVTIARHIKNSNLSTIICGDFNDTPVSYVYNTMRGNLKDAFVESGKGLAGTYNGILPSLRIDFIFHDAKFASHNFKRFKVDYSDHYPIMSTIDLKN